jgi:hypothetical protein
LVGLVPIFWSIDLDPNWYKMVAESSPLAERNPHSKYMVGKFCLDPLFYTALNDRGHSIVRGLLWRNTCTKEPFVF